MSFIAAIVVPTKFTPAQIKPQSFESRWNSSSFLPGVDASHVYIGAWALGCFHSHISTQTFWRALTVLVDSCAEIKSAPSVAYPNLAEFGGRCQKAMLGVCNEPYLLHLLVVTLEAAYVPVCIVHAMLCHVLCWTGLLHYTCLW